AGNAVIARLLESRGVILDLVLDEGGAIVEGILTMVPLPVALLGIAEKGYITLELSASQEGGHSSMPARETNVDIVCAAVTRLVRHQFPTSIAGVIGSMMRYLAPEAPVGTRLVLSNLWLFGPLARWQLSDSPSTAASLHTTIAPTMMTGSNKENVIPPRASAVVNFRILPGETSKDVIAQVKEAIDDPRVAIRVLGTAKEPSEISSIDSPLFGKLHTTVRQIFPRVIVTPYLVLGGTDSRHYRKICENVYRFCPYTMRKEDLNRAHGLNERITVNDMKRMVSFYTQLVKNLDE
ncbi:MAG: M20/M25/M40 family metallo-hydrolase, partial [Spirochaetes bacterium]|nr:M20/M25/M40 family metallo-hydrolase [Spirochaetota bacterium]